MANMKDLIRDWGGDVYQTFKLVKVFHSDCCGWVNAQWQS